jgi:hypothetical protein
MVVREAAFPCTPETAPIGKNFTCKAQGFLLSEAAPELAKQKSAASRLRLEIFAGAVSCKDKEGSRQPIEERKRWQSRPRIHDGQPDAPSQSENVRGDFRVFDYGYNRLSMVR